MSKLLHLVLVLTMAACSKHTRDNGAVDPVDPLEGAEAKAAVYLSLAGEAKDGSGFVHSKCDGLLFTALHVVAGGQADLMQAQGEPGRWYRHAEHDCYDLEQAGQPGSKSDISNDMLLGLLWWAWETGNLAVVEDLIAYGKANNWKMGRGDPFRAVMRPTLIATAYDVRRALGGASENPPVEALLADPVDFEAHLAVLHALLRAHVHGAASDADIELFKKQAERQPRNALFQAAYNLYTGGDQSAAGGILGDSVLFPPDRLPTVHDRCEEYLFQRDEGDAWQPCPGDGRSHSGTDLLFSLKVAGNKLKKGG